MTKKIYKYKLGIDGDCVAIKNNFSRIIKVMAQNGWPYIWMEIDEENYDESEINITAIGTGWDYNDDAGVYVDSVVDGSGYVWHYFVDNPVFLSKQEKEQIKMISNSGILLKEPSILV